MKQRWLLGGSIAAALSLLGCSQPVGSTVPSAIVLAAPGSGSVTAYANVPGAEATRSVQLDSPVWRKADIHHLDIALYRADATTPAVRQSVARAKLNASVAFENLVPNTPYHVVIRAWADEAELTRIDNADADPATCTTDFTTTTAPTVDAGALKLKLKRKDAVLTWAWPSLKGWAS